MRFHLILATALILAGPALASSIETVGVTVKAGSIVVKSCADCPAPKPVVHRDSYIVPALRTGTQTIELKDINRRSRTRPPSRRQQPRQPTPPRPFPSPTP